MGLQSATTTSTTSNSYAIAENLAVLDEVYQVTTKKILELKQQLSDQPDMSPNTLEDIKSKISKLYQEYMTTAQEIYQLNQELSNAE